MGQGGRCPSWTSSVGGSQAWVPLRGPKELVGLEGTDEDAAAPRHVLWPSLALRALPTAGVALQETPRALPQSQDQLEMPLAPEGE